MRCKVNVVLNVRIIMPCHVRSVSWLCGPLGQNNSVNTRTCAQKELDIGYTWNIIIFTVAIWRNSVDGRRSGSPVQTRCFKAQWDFQSASGRRHRSPLPNRRFLRSPRPRAGQVRDASPRKSGQAVGEPISLGIRLLAAHFLSGGRRFSTRRFVRAAARQARAPSRPQTYSRGSGLRYPTPGKRSSHSSSGFGCCDPEALRHNGPSAQRRARTGSAGKKTSLNRPGGARDVAKPRTPISAYEDLRQQATDGSSSGGLGMALFLSQGMVAWMRACSWVSSTTPDNLRRCPTAAVSLPNDLRGEVVLVLAAMALNQASEVRP
jgi:hypothetical protein